MTEGDIHGLKVVAPGVYSEINLNTLFASKNVVRESHTRTAGNEDVDLMWNVEFPNTNYVFTITGYTDIVGTTGGEPVEIFIKQKTSTCIVVRTLVACYLMAIAYPYASEL